MPAFAIGSKKPRIHRTTVIAPSATIIGDVVIGPRTSVWPGAVVRGDYGYIRIGSDCSIQDNVVVHCSAEDPTIIGDGVTVAHSAVIHGCRVGDKCLIGVGAIIFDGSTIGSYSILGVGCTVLGRGKIPARSVAVGSPAKVIRKATKRDLLLVESSYKAYVEMSSKYARLGAFKSPVG